MVEAVYGDSVIRAARLSAIEALLRERHVLSTSALADEMGVSHVTVRRDLDTLADAGRIERVFGGARLLDTPRRTLTAAPRDPAAPDHETADEPFDQVLGRNAAAKRAIAQRAAALVNDGDTLFIDIGTTAYLLARELVDRRLAVVTASLSVVDLLGPAPDIELVVLGGEYNREYRCTQGAGVAHALTGLQIDRAFLGCAGVSERGAVRDTDARQAAIKRAAVAAAGTRILLADSSKFPGVGMFTAVELDQLDTLVTDAPASTLSPTLRDLATASTPEVLTP